MPKSITKQSSEISNDRRLNMVEAINDALDIMLERDPNVTLLGEDIGYFGGVLGVLQVYKRNMVRPEFSIRR